MLACCSQAQDSHLVAGGQDVARWVPGSCEGEVEVATQLCNALASLRIVQEGVLVVAHHR